MSVTYERGPTVDVARLGINDEIERYTMQSTKTVARRPRSAAALPDGSGALAGISPTAIRALVRPAAAPLRKIVIERLRDAILAFVYAPGERLVEREVCERFGVSRTVVREALRHLEAEGLVDLVPNRGPVVATITAAEARALYEVREALESLAARYCAERATPAQKRQIAKALTRVETAYRKGRIGDELAAKAVLYEALFAGSGNSVIAATLRPMHARAQMLRAFSLQVPGRADQSLRELRAVVRAIERGDAKTAARYAALHVRNAGAAALSKLDATILDDLTGC